MGSKRKRRIGIVLATIAVALITFGVVWVTIIFPGLKKLPADLNQAVQYQGTVTVLDPETYQPVTYDDVILTRRCQAVRSSGDVIYIEEEVSFVDSKTGLEISSLYGSELLAVDRVSRANVPGYGDENREGLWQFPLDVKTGQDYPVWLTGSPTTLDARYVGEKDFRGLHVLVYEIATPDEGVTTPAGIFTPEMQLYRWIKVRVEPASGVTVYMEDTQKRTSKIPVFDDLFPNTGDITFTDMTVFETSLVFTEETIEREVDDASFYRWALSWGNTYLPWLVFGFGVVMGLLGSILVIGVKVKRIPIAKPAKDDLAQVQPTSLRLSS